MEVHASQMVDNHIHATVQLVTQVIIVKCLIHVIIINAKTEQQHNLMEMYVNAYVRHFIQEPIVKHITMLVEATHV